MSIFRVSKTKDFVAINNTALRDSRLSWGARGILAYLLTKPDDWEVRSSDLVEQGTQKREAVLKMLRELETCGYLQRQRTKNPHSGRYEWETHVYEVPQSAFPTEGIKIPKNPNKSPKSVLPTQESPTQVSPTQENPTVKEILNKEILNKNTEVEQSSPCVEVAKIFAYWQTTLKHPKAKLTPERARAIRGRLKEGYTTQDIMDAIDGCAASPFNRGENDRNRAFDYLTLICRNGEKLENFIRMKGVKVAHGKSTNEDKLRTILERRTQASIGEHHPRDEADHKLVSAGRVGNDGDGRSLALTFG